MQWYQAQCFFCNFNIEIIDNVSRTASFLTIQINESTQYKISLNKAFLLHIPYKIRWMVQQTV